MTKQTFLVGVRAILALKCKVHFYPFAMVTTIIKSKRCWFSSTETPQLDKFSDYKWYHTVCATIVWAAKNKQAFFMTLLSWQRRRSNGMFCGGAGNKTPFHRDYSHDSHLAIEFFHARWESGLWLITHQEHLIRCVIYSRQTSYAFWIPVTIHC